MLKAAAVAHFGTQQKLADAIGLAQSTVAGWTETVPLEWAFVLETLTARDPNSPLSIEFEMYPKLTAEVVQAMRANARAVAERRAA
jgi:hypothetical protein